MHFLAQVLDCGYPVTVTVPWMSLVDKAKHIPQKVAKECSFFSKKGIDRGMWIWTLNVFTRGPL